MKTRIYKPLVYFLGGLVTAIMILFQFAFRDTDKKEDRKTAVNALPDTWQPPRLPDQMDFAGEAVPLDRWEVREEMDRQLLYNYYAHSNILYILKLANRYFPLIQERLKANGVPDDFKYLCIAESNLQNAISKAGAVGFWQFMSYTAPGYNLEINKDVDFRYDVIRATDAACAYLKTAYAKFGTWTGAAASYNCGQGGYQSHATFQKTMNYYDLMLPEETNRYIFRILTFKYLISNANRLGYVTEPGDLYQPLLTRTVDITASIPNLADFAIKNGITYKRLKLLNPWLRSRALMVKPGKTYQIKLPAEDTK